MIDQTNTMFPHLGHVWHSPNGFLEKWIWSKEGKREATALDIYKSPSHSLVHLNSFSWEDGGSYLFLSENWPLFFFFFFWFFFLMFKLTSHALTNHGSIYFSSKNVSTSSLPEKTREMTNKSKTSYNRCNCPFTSHQSHRERTIQ